MSTRDILLVGERSAEWLNRLQSSASSMGIHLISAGTFRDGIEMLRQYAEAVDGVVVDVSSAPSSEHAESCISEMGSIAPELAMLVVGAKNATAQVSNPDNRQRHFMISAVNDPQEILTRLRQVLGNGKACQVSRSLPCPASVRVTELCATHDTRSNYVAQFAYRLESCFVARNENEERDARAAAIRWHYDLLTMVSLLDSDIQLSIRFVHIPGSTGKKSRLTVWLAGSVYAQTGSVARTKAVDSAIQLEDFLAKGASCFTGMYGFVPVRQSEQLSRCLRPFQPVTILQFRHKSILVNSSTLTGMSDIPPGVHIAAPARPGHLRTLHWLIEVLSHQSAPVMLEIILQPTRLTAHEIELLRCARNNVWKQESSLTYSELQAVSLELDDLLRSSSRACMTEARLWFGEEHVPESLLATISQEYYLPLSEMTRLGDTQTHDGCCENKKEVERLSSLTSLGCAVELFRLPLPTQVPLRDVPGSHPVFDFTPGHLPSSGPILGHKNVGGERIDVRVSPEDFRRHVYILGQTGTGKSTMLLSMILERIESDRGLCLIDPHGDLLSEVYSRLTNRERSRTIVFDPSDVSNTLGLNMLEYDPSHPEQKTLLVNEMINIFDMLYDLRQTGGPIFEQYMRNAMLLVMDDPVRQGTLVDVVKVFQESEYRNDLVAECENELVKAFWLEAIRTKGEAGLDYLSPYITSKLNQFISNDYIFPIISRRKSGLDFRELIDSDKILLVKLSKGRLGEIGVRLLGMILFARLLLAALSRDDIQENQRKDFCLFVDEFQNFTSESVAQMLSEARKYRLNLVLANQTLGQLRNSILDSVLGNVGSLVIFRPGINDFDRIKPYIDPPFQRDEILNLPNFFAIGKLLSQGVSLLPFVFNTVNPSKKRA